MSGGGKIIGGGIGAAAIALIAMLFGVNPSSILGGGDSPRQTEQAPGQNDAEKQFVARVLGTTEDVWSQVFQGMGRNYQAPTLVMFTRSVQSGCGNASSATGPFYCPLDSKVYLDYSFFEELRSRFGASGDAANAYVIAHEVGHHVQNLLGISDQVRDRQQQVSEAEANRLSVRLELQADFLAGLWAHYADQLNVQQKKETLFEEGDLDEIMNAANAIGDDRLQMQAQGYVVPDAFTHGTSAQRKEWFLRGFRTGDIKQGDTFAADL